MTDAPVLALPSFLESAANLPKEIRSHLIKTLRLLSHDVRHPGLQTKKIQGAKNSVFECRVDQGVRLIYDMPQGTLRCWYVGEHDVAIRYGTVVETHGKAVYSDDVELVQGGDASITLIGTYLDNGSVPSDFRSVAVPSIVEALGVVLGQ